jgi:hypothetical protein
LPQNRKESDGGTLLKGKNIGNPDAPLEPFLDALRDIVALFDLQSRAPRRSID